MAEFLPQLHLKPVTDSAFSIARYKIKSQYFKDWSSAVAQELQQVMPPKYWKGYRLYAGDGTTVCVPVSKETVKHFGLYAKTEADTKTVMANACMIYDVLSHYVIDAKIDNTDKSEFTLIQEMLRNASFTENGILILDRGFSKFYFYKMLTEMGIRFCIRQKTSVHDFSKKILDNPNEDIITQWHPSEAEAATCKQKGLMPCPIKVRATKIELSSGETELLITNLFDQESLSTEDLKTLYHFRWNIEEAFKQLKPQMKLEQFGCRKSEGIYQEFYAHIIMINVISLIAQLAEPKIEQQTQDRKYRYKYNKVNAWKFIRAKIIELYKGKNIVKILSTIADKIANSIVAIVPNRTFSRKHKFKRKNRFSPMYK